jgi:L-asparaginase / beta-aspartyl-peptidase
MHRSRPARWPRHAGARAGPVAGAAAEASLAHLERVGGEAGGIVLDRLGRVGWAHNSSHFAVAWVTDTMAAPTVRLRQDEEVN